MLLLRDPIGEVSPTEPPRGQAPLLTQPRKAPGVRFRQIAPADLPAVAALLGRGFQSRKPQYWEAALRYLKERDAPDGFPRYGYMLECDNKPVGVLLLIYTAGWDGNPASLRCNLSSWHVESEFRHLAPLLIQPLLRQVGVTFVNTSPAQNTLPIIEAQGFRRFCNGTFLAAPVLAKWRPGVRLVDWRAMPDPADRLPAWEVALLRAHHARGCICVVLRDEGKYHPLVFRRRRVRYGCRIAWMPCAQLIYARDLNDIARFACGFGRHLALRGMPLVLISANGAIAGVPGVYFDGKGVMYSRGPAVPRLGDFAYTEGALFGV